MAEIYTPRLTRGIKSAWAVSELPVAVYVVLTIGFLTFYATQALGIEPWLAGAVLLVPRLWDAFTDPLMGAISDRTKQPDGAAQTLSSDWHACFLQSACHSDLLCPGGRIAKCQSDLSSRHLPDSPAQPSQSMTCPIPQWPQR